MKRKTLQATRFYCKSYWFLDLKFQSENLHLWTNDASVYIWRPILIIAVFLLLQKPLQAVLETLNNESPFSEGRSDSLPSSSSNVSEANPGGHVIKLGPGNDTAAQEALAILPGGLQVGGGITIDNAKSWLDKGAAKVGVSRMVAYMMEAEVQSVVFSEGKCFVFDKTGRTHALLLLKQTS